MNRDDRTWEDAPDNPALHDLDGMLADLQAGKIGINQPQDGGDGKQQGQSLDETGETSDTASDTVSEAKSASGKSRKKESTSVVKEIISWIQVLVAAAVIAFFIDHVLIANSQIPSGSMEPTIMTGARVIGSRLSYLFGDPERGDIAIFVYPDDEAQGIRTYYVKRIIGLPGDTIDIVDGSVYLNGSETPLDEPYLKEPMMLEPPMHFEVPEDCYFMMGDNRNDSNDSRRWENTYVKRNKLTAKVLFQYFPKIQTLH